MIKLTPKQGLVIMAALVVAILSFLFLIFADSRDFINSCDPYSVNSGITCPLK